ncbi:hypothetical protein Tco_1029010 [Tanacetum coccineum]|uniref:Uncharacterized protein n=1 Tax=Tanacetum coccineum TaxID=301880 RepID=A0ABQ5G3S9_9ASTR
MRMLHTDTWSRAAYLGVSISALGVKVRQLWTIHATGQPEMFPLCLGDFENLGVCLTAGSAKKGSKLTNSNKNECQQYECTTKELEAAKKAEEDTYEIPCSHSRAVRITESGGTVRRHSFASLLSTTSSKADPEIFKSGEIALEYLFFEGDGSSFDERGYYGVANDDYEEAPIFDDDQYEDVIEEEEGFKKNRCQFYDTDIEDVIDGEENNMEDVVVVANDLFSSKIQTTVGNAYFKVLIYDKTKIVVGILNIHVLLGLEYLGDFECCESMSIFSPSGVVALERAT